MIINAIVVWCGLLVVIVLVTLLARKVGLPEALLLVPAGIILSLVPGLPKVGLNPELALYFFLPLLIYIGAGFGSWGEFQYNLRPIILLSVGLVLFTVMACALTAHYLFGFGWPTSFILGAVIAPTDDVASMAIFERIRIPHRIISVLEGEGLVNDATSLTIFRFALAAMLTGVFTLWQAPLYFIGVVFGEIGYGLMIGWFITYIRRRLNDTSLEITLALLTPFAAYLPAELLGGTGVLSTVAAGFFIITQAPRFTPAATRLQLISIFRMISFLLNNLLFLILGLQLSNIIKGIHSVVLSRALEAGLFFSILVVVLRFIWVFPATYLPRIFSASLRARDPSPPWQWPFTIAWTGIRGAISLAAALSIPLALPNGDLFPQRNLIIFITFCVILVTLVLQGLSLPWLVGRLGLTKAGMAEQQTAGEKALVARMETLQAGLARVEALGAERNLGQELIAPLRQEYQARLDQLRRNIDGQSNDEDKQLTLLDLQLQGAALQAERKKIIELRRSKRIDDVILHELEHDLDLQETRLQHAVFHAQGKEVEEKIGSLPLF